MRGQHQVHERKTIAWVVYRLDDLGGGERLLLEGAKYYRSIGYRVIIVTWSFDERALFDGLYENHDIFDLGIGIVSRKRVIRAALARAKGLFALRGLLKKNNVSLVFAQGEYDVALLYLARLFSKIRYRFLVFGQMFQYPHDHAKYALVFRKHLKKIVESCPGYASTIPLRQPKIGFIQRIANEMICLVRYVAVRSAEHTFSFSRQVQWETETLYGVTPSIAKGAYPAEICSREAFAPMPFEKFKMASGSYILSLSRLDPKKRIDIIIRAFSRIPDFPGVLVIGGTGPHEQNLRDEVVRLGLNDKVVFAGRVDEDDLLTLKHHCALFVSLDIGDFDISPLEALAVGASVVCPTEFELDDNLEACEALRICSATDADVAATMSSMLDEQIRPDRKRLVQYSWEQYFDRLISQDVA